MNRTLPLPRPRGEPCPRLLARAVTLRLDAAETAEKLGRTRAADRAIAASLLREHLGLSLRALAAEQSAHGRATLAQAYVAAARAAEAGA